MIKCLNLTKKFGDLAAVDNLNLDIAPGEIFGFLGPNGAGKTTTVKLFSGLLTPTQGQVIIGGYDIQQEPRLAKKILAYIPDTPFIYPKLTGWEFLCFVGDLYEVPVKEQKKRIGELLEVFELVPFKDELIENYSRGMHQKLALSAGLLHNPKVMLVDEPIVGLDPKSSRILKEILLSLSKKQVSIFMCTHILEIAEKMCHRIGIIQSGKLISLETHQDLQKEARTGGNLEDLYLRLTGGTEYADLLKHL